MLGKKIIEKSLTLLTALAVLCVYSTVALAQSGDMTGDITVNGQVTVNGQTAVSNSTVMSGSTIVTGTNSSAIISLGKNGRVEIMSDSSVNLKFTENSIVGMLSSGKVRVTDVAGIASTVTTRNATAIADTGQANTFSVDVGCGDDVKCTQTFVETTSGLVTLRSGNTDKQVAAGADASVGNASQTGCQPCMRPGSAPPTAVAGFGAGALTALLLAAGGAVAAAVYLTTKDGNNVTLGGTTNVISPLR